MPRKKKDTRKHRRPDRHRGRRGRGFVEVETLASRAEGDGGRVLTRYREPFGGRWLLLASLPIDRVRPTPYQRELSETHVKNLANVIPKIGRFLDPIIAIAEKEAYWTPNGMHRLEAMRGLGAKAIIALLAARLRARMSPCESSR